ncbi:metal ABC transporter solute-binding protein, Zn/Mn family [Anthocerotibacter panamensis]|uniref:metal ABC transporter solute-binding protein, Zn/Mn family n=1 Tax=Anthocerotibacter panamensis TaxID=2857077 RepID=UPI001C405BAA|nr:zinc ABC transporter substrate-binding protein [Anthocerotibacter panamensis]
MQFGSGQKVFLFQGLVLALCIFLITACGSPNPGAPPQGVREAGLDPQAEAFLKSEKPKVVATTTILADLIRNVAGENFAVFSILRPGVDPHVYESTPGDSRVISGADLIFSNGLYLEPKLIKVIAATENPAPKITVAEAGNIQPLKPVERSGLFTADPHCWGSPDNAIRYVDTIEKALAQHFPDQKATFAANASRYRRQIQALGGWIKGQIATIPPEKRFLVTSHDAFQYYSKFANLPVLGSILGLSTEEEPSVKKITTLVEKVKKAGAVAVFTETSTSPKLITALARESGVKIGGALYSDSLGIEGSQGDTYLKSMAANTQTIVEALGGTYTAFVPSTP